jgi:hypothetical protein
MTVIVTFKNNTDMKVHRVVNVIAILTTKYSTKLVQISNRVQSFENCDIENMFLENMGK